MSSSAPKIAANGDALEASEHIPKTMRGVVVTKLNSEVEIQDNIVVPEPEGGQLLIKITACSLCNSDLAGISGYTPAVPPYVPGHEPVGHIVKLGPASPSSFKVGDRVGYMPATNTCGSCPSCLTSNHRFCKSRINIGFSGKYGGFSQYSLADPLSTVKIPDGLSDDEAAPLLCAGVTAYGAVRKAAQFQPPGTWINVVGCGGVGHLVIQFAAKLGFDVQAFDISDDKLDLAKRCGAVRVYRSDRDLPADTEYATSTIVVTGAPAAYEFALNKLAQEHGKIIAIGVPSQPVSLNVFDMVVREISLITTNQGSKEELVACLELAAKRNIKPIIERRDIEAINQGIADIKGSKVTGRYVYSF